MPYFVLGLALTILGIIFLRNAHKTEDRDGVIGSTGLLIGGIILMLLFGIFYNAVSLKL